MNVFKGIAQDFSFLTIVLYWQTNNPADRITISTPSVVHMIYNLTKLTVWGYFVVIFLHQNHQKFVEFILGNAQPCLFKKKVIYSIIFKQCSMNTENMNQPKGHNILFRTLI